MLRKSIQWTIALGGTQQLTHHTTEVTMDRYVCTLCGYVYDPEAGDPDNGVAPGTKWEDVPSDWTCPVCGAGKEDFEKEE